MFCRSALRQKQGMQKAETTFISMHTGAAPDNTALMSAQSLPSQDGSDGAPEWIHLLPAGEITTDDARGPYSVSDPAAVIAASFQNSAKLPVDINHSTHKLGALGHEAPAVGWLTEMQSRDDGIWGRVEWSKRGAQMLVDREYRGISPVIRHTSAKDIVAITCASLTNNPNLRGMTALHQKEDGMNFRDKLIEMLGLDATASDEDVMKALTAKLKGDTEAPAMQSALGEIGVALGLAQDAKPADIVTAAQAATSGDDTAVTALQASNAALQSSVTALTATVTSLQSGQAEAASEAFYETALQERRAGVNAASKGDWIALHQADPARAAAIVGALPKLGATATTLQPPEATNGEIALNSSQKAVAAQMGMSEKDYAAELKSDGNEEVA